MFLVRCAEEKSTIVIALFGGILDSRVLCSQLFRAFSANFSGHSPMSSSANGPLMRAAKRHRGVNPMMAGMNPFLASMFGPAFAQANALNPQMFGAAMDYDEADSPGEGDNNQVVAGASAAPSTGAPTDTHASVVPTVLPSPPEEDVNVRLSPDLLIGRGITYLKQCHRNRLAECIELCCPRLEQATTAQLSVPGLCCLLWVLTRMLPTVKISNLGASASLFKTYCCFLEFA